MRIWTLGIGVALTSSPVFAESTDFVSPLLGTFEAGVLCAPDTQENRAAPDTIAGQTHVIDETPPFVSRGRVVPAAYGIGFGASAGLMSEDGMDNVTITFTHPPFKGFTATEQSFLSHIGPKDDPAISYYQFDHDYELALGTWVMTAEKEGATLFEVTFTVVPPSALPGLAAACGYTDLLS